MKDRYKIDLYSFNSRSFTSPYYAEFEIKGLTLVHPNSGNGLKKTLEKIAVNFRREFQYDFTQYRADERNNYLTYETLGATKYKHMPIGYLFSTQSFKEKFNAAAYGGCCFRFRDEGWALQWVWFHPYFRRRGNLSEHWESFKKLFGVFPVEGPYSSAMKAFLEKQSRTSK